LVKQIIAFNTALLSNEDQFDNLQRYGGLSRDDIINNNIGWDDESNTYTIPIKDNNGAYTEIVNKHLDDISEWKDEIGKEYSRVSFEQSINSMNYGKEITFDGVIIGKDLSPFLIPWKVCIKCDEVGSKQKRCPFCVLQEEGTKVNKLSNTGELNYVFRCTEDREVILNFIDASDTAVVGFIKKYFKIPDHTTCRRVSIDISERQNVEEVMIAPSLDYNSLDGEYTVQKSYLFSSDIKTNAQYQFYGTTWNEPKTQRSTHILSRVKSSLDSISKWKLDRHRLNQLALFKSAHDVDSIKAKLEEIHTDLAVNVTKIKMRNNVIQAFDMVYHSVLQFDFLGNRLTKGWMECLIGGDTRTGKSETIKTIVKYYRAGEYMTSGENISLAGILGGVQQTHGNSRWSLTWGKIPLNDRGACIIDESEELTKQEIMGKLSGVRSSGIAELHKIQSRKTLARTRLIFIANPMHGKISEYSFGVDIVKELMGQEQDVARLDFAILCSKDDVPDSLINKRDAESGEPVYSSEMCHNRVMFSWTRTPEQVQIMRETEDVILQAAGELSKKFSSDIPLIIGAEMRIKLARMAVSIAAQVNSTDETGEIIIVHPAHAIVAVNYIESEYHSEAMGYADYSLQRRIAGKLKNEDILDKHIATPETVNMLLNCRHIQLQDIEDIFACERQEARMCISDFRKAGAIKKITYYYNKTSPFIEYLKKKRRELTGLHVNPLDMEDEDDD